MIYLNNAATSYPKPRQVIDAVNEYLISPPYHPSRSAAGSGRKDVFQACRENIARLFNIGRPERVAFTSGSTEALNLAIKGIGLEGSHVVTTAIEHNSVLRPLHTLKQEGKIDITIVPCDSNGYVSPEAIEEAITNKTKAVIINLCSNVTGAVLDAASISGIAHEKGCMLIVDGSQASGNIPVDIEKWDIDMYAFTGHKSLYGLPGTGCLYIKEGISPKPLKTGGTGKMSDYLLQPETMPMYYEAGTQNSPGITALNAGVEFVLKTGLDNIINHKKAQVDRIRNAFSEIPGMKIYGNRENNSGSVLAFNIEGLLPEETGYWLESSYDIEVRAGLHCAPLLREALGVYPWGTARVSPSYFTTDGEIDTFIQAIKEIAEFAGQNESNKNTQG